MSSKLTGMLVDLGKIPRKQQAIIDAASRRETMYSPTISQQVHIYYQDCLQMWSLKMDYDVCPHYWN